jgi:hypothetical protein
MDPGDLMPPLMPLRASISVWTRLFSLALGLGWLAACQGGGGISEQQFCAEYARRECEKLANLCVLPVADCIETRSGVCRQMVAAQKSDVRVYRPENVDACLNKVSATYSRNVISAAELRELNQVCARVFQGRAGLNQSCSVDEDCQAQLICDKRLCGPLRQVAPGGFCGNPGEVCIKEEYCRQAEDSRICTRRKEKGMACSDAEPCLEVLRCNGTCLERLAMSESCAVHDDCLSEYCSPFMSKCTPGVSFGEGALACDAYFGKASTPAPDAGATD